MITYNKLANQSNNKLTKKFRPADVSAGGFKTGTKKWVKFLLLFLLMVTVAGGTFGVIWLVNFINKPEEEPVVINGITGEVISGGNDDTDIEGMDGGTASIQPITNAHSSNPTIPFGRLMLINPNYTVEPEFIAARKKELISLSGTYGIKELHSYNGDNLLDPEAAENLSRMVADYSIANPGHELNTVSCFRETGTNCGRLCMPTGASDHHTGLTCDLIDPAYGTSLDTNTYDKHIEWQWLKNNSYNYGFIDRFPEAWAGGSMNQPMNVDENGSTGLYETWHYRYVGTYAAVEIANGIYNNGDYDSLEHYLKMRSLVLNLLNNQ